MVVLISDLLDDPDAITKGLAHFRHKRHEVIVFHLIDKAEREFPYDRVTRFKDIEGSGTLIANPRRVKAKYLQRLNEYLQTIRRNCLERDISYELTQTDTPFAQMLQAYLGSRRRAGI